MLHVQHFVVCPEHRGGPYTRSYARSLTLRWNGLNLIHSDDGTILAHGCNPHRIIVRIGREKPREPSNG